MYTLHTHRFNMPQLNRERTIRVLLPRDYFDSDHRYPVIYMQDGQNLFDPATAFGGNDWKIPTRLQGRHHAALPAGASRFLAATICRRPESSCPCSR